MAVTATATVATNIAPSGYSIQSAPSFPGTAKEEISFSADIAVGSIPDASEATAMGNLVTALETWGEDTKAVAMGLDATETILMQLHVTTFDRVDRAASPLNAQDVIYRVAGSLYWEKTS